tara:strand:- start:1288 stop:1542 length:255 start_codon:yes stop_codon:yes gene_type:complete
MSKYTIYSTKQDWENLYKEFQIMKDVYSFNIDIKKIKKSTSYDSMWSMLQLMKRKVGLYETQSYKKREGVEVYESVNDYLNKNK